jgi:hypothetical protein
VHNPKGPFFFMTVIEDLLKHMLVTKESEQIF